MPRVKVGSMKKPKWSPEDLEERREILFGPCRFTNTSLAAALKCSPTYVKRVFANKNPLSLNMANALAALLSEKAEEFNEQLVLLDEGPRYNYIEALSDYLEELSDGVG